MWINPENSLPDSKRTVELAIVTTIPGGSTFGVRKLGYYAKDSPGQFLLQEGHQLGNRDQVTGWKEYDPEPFPSWSPVTRDEDLV